MMRPVGDPAPQAFAVTCQVYVRRSVHWLVQGADVTTVKQRPILRDVLWRERGCNAAYDVVGVKWRWVRCKVRQMCDAASIDVR